MLEFHPYPIPEQQQTPNTGLQLLDKAAQMAQLYQSYKQQKIHNDVAKQQRAADHAKNIAEYGDDYAKNYQAILDGKPPTVGAAYQLDIPGKSAMSVPPAMSPFGPQLPQPGGQGFVGPQNAPVQGPQNAPIQGPQSAPAAQPGAPDISGMAPHEQSIALLTPQKMAEIKKQKGTKGLKEVMDQATFFSGQGKAQNDIDQNAPATPEEVRAALSPFGDKGSQAAEALIGAAKPKGGMVPKYLLTNTQSSLSQSGRGDAMQGMVDMRTQQFGENKWQDLGKEANILASSGSSPLHAAAIANQRADRALTVLNNPQASSQDLNTALADLSGIFQGGAPHEQSIGQQQYQTLQNRINEVKTFLTSQPQAANQPEVQAKIRQVIMDVKNVDNNVIQKELQFIEAKYAPYVKQDPQRWELIKKQALTSLEGPAAYEQHFNSAGASEIQAKLQSAQAWLAQNPNDPQAAAVRQRVASLQGGR